MARITEEKKVKIYKGKTCNPIYLAWLNTLGYFDYWLFHTKQLISYDIDGEIIVRDVEDLEIDTTIQDYISRNAVKSVVIGANDLILNDIEGLKGLLYSIRVQVLTNPDDWVVDGCKWQTVIVKSGSFNLIETNQSKFSIELEIMYPQINIQSQ
jgi:hypothetical protein